MTAQERGMAELGTLIAAAIPPQMEFVCIVIPKVGAIPEDGAQINIRRMPYVSNIQSAERAASAALMLPEMQRIASEKIILPGGKHS